MRRVGRACIVGVVACAPPGVGLDDDSDALPDPATTDSDLPAEASTFAFGPIVACDDPAARDLARFDVVTLPGEPVDDGLYRLVGGGAVVADLDHDGALDVFLPGRARHALVVRAPAGGVVDTWASRVAPGVDLSLATGASAVDVEGDGDLDLLVTRWDLAPVLLLQEDGIFVDRTAEAGLGAIARALGSTWGDLDGDGDLDLFVGTYGPHPRDAFATTGFESGDRKGLWENRGDGTFVDRGELLPPEVHASYTFTGAWQDLDGDLRPELLLINDFGWARPDRLLWNRGGTLVDDDGSAGIALPFAGMGLGLGDFNGDGVVDLVQSSWKDASLLQSIGASAWAEMSRARGLRPVWSWDDDEVPPPEGWANPTQVFGWGTEVVDLDADGDEDVVMNFGYWDEYGRDRRQRNAVFEQDADGSFHDRAAAWGYDDDFVSRGLAVGDLDGDGLPDLVERNLDGPTRVFLSRCGTSGWLRIRLHGPAPNVDGIGARVRVTAGARSWTRWIRAGGTGMFGASAAEALFGLGALDRVDRVDVDWADGAHSSAEGVDTRRVIDVIRTR